MALAWRANVTVPNPFSTEPMLKVNWQPTTRYKWITIRIYLHGSLLGESALDAGDASCTGRGPYGGGIPKLIAPYAPPGTP